MKISHKIVLWTLAKMVSLTGNMAQWVLGVIRRDMPVEIVRRTSWTPGDQHRWDVLPEDAVTPSGKIGGSGVVQVSCVICYIECSRANFSERCPGPPGLNA